MSPLSVAYRHPNDGTNPGNTATVTNHLLDAYPNGRVSFVVPAGAYVIAGGQTESQVLSDDGRFVVVTARVDIPASGSATVSITRKQSGGVPK